jgi:LysR family glycine cleavage system transcriptional activator
MRRLPSLNGVRSFEAAARRGGFAAAAEELNVTPAAVSRMTRLLEERLGVALFVRTANRLTLTPAGRLYEAGLAPIFDALAALTEQVTTISPGKILTIGVGPTFAIRWLIPRLADFRLVAPDVEVRITTGGAAASAFGADWTCGIKLGRGDWPGLQADPLFPADLTPVCAPSLAGQLHTAEDLTAQSLLRVAHAPDDWSLWFTKASLPALEAKGPIFAYYGQAQQAACDGLGVALGLRPYIDDDLRAGRLIAPFPVSAPKGEQWFLTFKEMRAEEPAFVAFRRWLSDSVTNAPE